MSADEPTLAADDVVVPPPPVVLPPRYRDLGRIAGGAFGEVRRVEDTHLGSVLAMKLLRPERVDAETRRRFAEEARLTARLHHPGIVAVQDLGELPDGRLWYTMEEVRGDTLGEVLRRLHAGDGTLRRVVDALMRAAQAVASAHAAGVLHRDLKPDNVMIGAFGEVRVMDWGLARRIGTDEAEGRAAPTSTTGTQAGRVMGTPAYMAPEQARGETTTLRPTADVYALGAMLYAVLAGHAPYPGDGRAAWLAVLAGPPREVRTVAPWRVPDELADLTGRAMARDPALRHRDAAAFADALAGWLEGARRRAEAEALVDRARERLPDALRLRRRATELADEAAGALADTLPSDPADHKRAAWRLEDEAADLRAQARRVDAEVVQDLRAALLTAPDLADAHDLLADHHRARLEEAEARGDTAAALEAELALRVHDRGRHTRWLDGHGTVTLVTDPPGASVEVFRFEERERRLVAVPAGELGPTPLVDVQLPRGSYVLVLRASGHLPVRYPVVLGRLDTWTGVAPGEAAPRPIRLPRARELDADDVYIPAGQARFGGDTRALDSLPARRLWVDAFVMRRHPVTVAEYLVFLDALAAAGEDPTPFRPASSGEVFVTVRDGRHALVDTPASPQALRLLDGPVAWVSPRSADRYAAWAAAASGLAWRLPHELEWEKAARGVDGRAFPWGDRLDPSQACMQLSHPGVPTLASVHAHPEDESVYGVRGLGGNVRDICGNAWRRDGPADGGRVLVEEPPPPDAPWRSTRGGAIFSPEADCRAASRTVVRPAAVGGGVGFRLSRSFS